MPDTSSISLNADLDKAFTLLFADGLDSENGGVGMRSNHSNRITGLKYTLVRHATWTYTVNSLSYLPLLTNGKCNQGRSIAGKVVFSTRLES